MTRRRRTKKKNTFDHIWEALNAPVMAIIGAMMLLGLFGVYFDAKRNGLAAATTRHTDTGTDVLWIGIIVLVFLSFIAMARGVNLGAIFSWHIPQIVGLIVALFVVFWILLG